MFETCLSTLLILIIGLLNTLMDITIFGFNIVIFVMDLLTTVLLVLLVNWLCNNNWYTLSWLLAIIISLITFSGIYLYRIKDPEFMKEIDNQKKAINMKKK
jgi:hypothetical protein